MRSYGKNFIYKKTVNYKERQARLATEWDVRVDVNDAFTADDVVKNLQLHEDELLYGLVSGVEQPDTSDQVPPSYTGQRPKFSPSGSHEHHVHVCIVLHAPLQRLDVLKLVRGPRKMGDEYCAPRNPKFTYAGWVIHHGKPGFKLDGEPLVRFEFGTPPMDPFTTDSAVAIVRLLKKWGTPEMEQRFKGYTDLLNKEKIKAKIEQFTMLLEDQDAT
jgi:hypothetical protein